MPNSNRFAAEKRKKYDLLRNANKKVNQKNYNNSSDYTFSDLFQKNKKTKEEPKAIQGEDITVNVTIDSKEAILGTTRTVNIATSILCPKCEGHKFANNQKLRAFFFQNPAVSCAIIWNFAEFSLTTRSKVGL